MRRSPCGEQSSQWEKCLAKSGRNPSKCTKFETELRKCGATSREELCIDETVNLMNCTKSTGSDLCSKEFVNFRECRRVGGRQLVEATEGGYGVVEAAKWAYIDEGRALRVTANAGTSLAVAADQYAKSLGLAGGSAELRF